MQDSYRAGFKIALDALRQISAEANVYQGQWQHVDVRAAPDWTHGLKAVESLADVALTRIENLSINDYTEKAEPLPYLSDNDRQALIAGLENQDIVIFEGETASAKAATLLEQQYVKVVHKNSTILVGILTESGKDVARRL